MSELKPPSVLIAELHAAGLSNDKIGYLLAQHGGKTRSEGCIRSWAMRVTEPAWSEYVALKALRDAVIVEIYEPLQAD